MALFIIRTSIEIFGAGGVEIIGRRADSKLAKRLRRKIGGFPGVKEVSDLVLHSYGPTTVIGAAKIKVSGEMKAKELAKLTKEIETVVFEEEQVRIIVGV